MKKIFLILLVLLSIKIYSQNEDKLSYQAIIRDNSNKLIKNSTIGIKISILQGSINGNIVYFETQSVLTNENGLLSIEIGSGAGFNTIDWSNKPYFVKTEIDVTGGSNYTLTATSQLLTVPFALHAKSADTLLGLIFERQELKDVLINNNSADNKNITNLANPINAQDAVTKYYVDLLIARIEALETSEPMILVDGFSDPRDGNHYNVVKIGNQIWMSENLKWLPSVVGPSIGSQSEPYYYVYGYEGENLTEAQATVNYTTYGVLYNWTAAVNSCPTGWHLPNSSEINELENYLADNGYNYDGTIGGGNVKIAKAFANSTGWQSSTQTGAVGNNDFPEYMNKSGFTALPGGARSRTGAFGAGDRDGWWWTTTIGGNGAYTLMIFVGASASGGAYYYKEEGYSVRCIRD